MFKPMLAGKLETASWMYIKYPVLASTKLDGVRATVQGGRLLSRSLKLIPNQYLQGRFGRPELEGLDGELIVGNPTESDAFRKTTSAVMTQGGCPNVMFHVFDIFHKVLPFEMRLEMAEEIVYKHHHDHRIRVVEHEKVLDWKILQVLEEQFIGAGYEGVMLRSLNGPYKQGRSTLTEGFLLKLKRFVDSEARVVGFEELMHNGNLAKTNELGYMDHSSHKENLVPMGMLGALQCIDVHDGTEVSLGTGFKEDERKTIWIDRQSHIDRIAKYKYFPTGAKDKKRHPVFKGWRDPLDMDQM